MLALYWLTHGQRSYATMFVGLAVVLHFVQGFNLVWYAGAGGAGLYHEWTHSVCGDALHTALFLLDLANARYAFCSRRYTRLACVGLSAAIAPVDTPDPWLYALLALTGWIAVYEPTLTIPFRAPAASACEPV